MSPIIPKRYLPAAFRGLIGLAVLAVALGFFALLFVTTATPARPDGPGQPRNARGRF